LLISCSITKFYTPRLVSQVLKLSDNDIVSVPPLRACFNLHTLDLSFNRIQNLSSLLSLRPCRYIERIQANDNPCSELPGYRPLLAALLPFVADLDNAPLPPREREGLRGLHLASDPLLAPLVLRYAPQTLFPHPIPRYQLLDLISLGPAFS